MASITTTTTQTHTGNGANYRGSFAIMIVLLAWSLASNTLRAATEILSSHPATQSGDARKWWMCRARDLAEGGAVISLPDFSAGKWQPAIVPGTVLNSLVANGVYPEPYFGTNNAHEAKLIPDLSETGPAFYTYWFRNEFVVPKSFETRRVWLQLDGINYRAEIWLNGRKLGDMAGMFKRGLFDVTDVARIGQTNALAVLVRPVDVPGGFQVKDKNKLRAIGENRNGGDGEMGRNTTMLMTAGWDFTFTDGIRDRNTGIWRDVKLFATGPVAVRHPFVKTKLALPNAASAQLTVQVEVVNATSQPQAGKLRAVIPQLKQTLEKPVQLAPGQTQNITLTAEDFPGLNVKNPRLWWPFNKGEQFLHDLKVSFLQDGAVSDESAIRFGIREITSDRHTPDQSRMFYVNGRRLFVHGDNWIPEAMCRTSVERTRASLRYTRQAGINFLRLWAGGVAESDEFFDECDALGILVWAEFWQSGDTKIPDDVALCRENIADTIKRIRPHPSLAYYVTSNERDGTAERPVIPMEDLVAELDGTRGWQVGSETDGIHDGSPYKSVNPMWYYEDSASARGGRINGFCPEYGCPILPTIDCLREMMDARDLWPINTNVWNYLDGGGFHEMTTEYDHAVRQYGVSRSIEEYAWKSQMFGGLAYRALWESWNYNRFEYGDRFTSGLLFWYHNSPNPQVCARLCDWSLEPTAALYFSQNAHEPLHAQFDFLKNTVSVNNEFPRAFTNCHVSARILNFDLKEVVHQTATVNLPADGVANDVIKVLLPENLSPVHFIRLDITDAQGKPVANTFYWRSSKAYQPGRTHTGPLYEGFEAINDLPRVELKAQVGQSRKPGANFYHVTVRNPSKNLAFMVWLRLQDAASSKPIRPAFYTDNFFSLLPGEAREVTIKYHGSILPAFTKLILDGWNVKTLQLKP